MDQEPEFAVIGSLGHWHERRMHGLGAHATGKTAPKILHGVALCGGCSMIIIGAFEMPPALREIGYYIYIIPRTGRFQYRLWITAFRT